MGIAASTEQMEMEENSEADGTFYIIIIIISF